MTLSSILADERDHPSYSYESISKGIQPVERPISGRLRPSSGLSNGLPRAGRRADSNGGAPAAPKTGFSTAARHGAPSSSRTGASDGNGRGGRPPVPVPRNGGSSSGANHGKQALDMSELLTSLRGWEVSDSLMASNGEGMLQGLNLGGTGVPVLLQEQIDEDYRRLQALENIGSPALSRSTSGNESSSSSPTMEGQLCEEAGEEEEPEEEAEAAPIFHHESLLESRKAAAAITEPPVKQGLGRPRERTSSSGSLVAKAKGQPVMPDCLQELMAAPGPDPDDADPEEADAVEALSKEHFTTYVREPGFPGTDPTIAFSHDARNFVREGLEPIKKKIYVRFGGIANSPVKNALKVAGIRRIKSSGFNLFWTAALGRDSQWWKVLNKYQRVNHFPGTWELGRKDKLYKNVAAMRRSKGSEFDFVPRFFILPREMEEFQQDIERNPSMMYIQKPLASSRGRGIKMVVKPKEMPKDSTCLVQRYIGDPLTIDGYKFDIRLYCVVTCFDPLKVYLYQDGLVRFATEKYNSNPSHLKKRCVHLTNYSVNKKKEGFVDADEGEDGVGFKWSFDPLRSYLEERGTPWSTVWDQMRAIVAKTIIAVEPKINTLVKMVVPHRNVCFEIYGFDIMLDANMKASLIEVNTGPSLGATTPIDRKVKFPLLGDLLNIIGLVPYDKANHEREAELKRAARLTGLGDKESRIRHRDIREAQEFDFTEYAPEELPEVVREAEAELTRRGGFHRVFPVPEDPCRYLELFEAPRYDTTLVCRYFDQKNSGFVGGSDSQGARRNSSRRAPSFRSLSRTNSNGSSTLPYNVSRTPSSGSLIGSQTSAGSSSMVTTSTARLKSSRAKLSPSSSRSRPPPPSSALPLSAPRRRMSSRSGGMFPGAATSGTTSGGSTSSSRTMARSAGSARIRARSPTRDTDASVQGSRRALSTGRPKVGGKTSPKKGRARPSSRGAF